MLHMEWADSTVWSAVHKFQGTEDKRLADLLNHLHMTQAAFLDAWRGMQFDAKSFRERSLAETEHFARECYCTARNFTEALDAAMLDRPVNLPWAEHFAKPANPTNLGETIMQVSQHSTYHRGQANMRLREIGGEPPLVDYIAWLWMGRPKANWPA